MRKSLKSLAAICLVALSITACKKETKPTATDEISQETLAKIAKLGLSTNDVQRMEGGYLAEGDIFVSEASLNESITSTSLRIAGEEQYRTTNLVTALPRTITVSVSGNVSSDFSTAVDGAIGRYNAENLSLTFQRVASGGNINIRIVNTGQYIASAGFPSGGNPYSEVKYAKKYSSYGVNFMTTVVAHELGHCIGFRHTDYMNRAYSCGTGGNEGDGGVGAIHIPGTASGPDAASWMLACLSSTTDRPFNANDKTALSYLY